MQICTYFSNVMCMQFNLETFDQFHWFKLNPSSLFKMSGTGHENIL